MREDWDMERLDEYLPLRDRLDEDELRSLLLRSATECLTERRSFSFEREERLFFESGYDFSTFSASLDLAIERDGACSLSNLVNDPVRRAGERLSTSLAFKCCSLSAGGVHSLLVFSDLTT